MTDINHHRRNRKPVNQRYPEEHYTNGYASPDNKGGAAYIEEYKAASGADHVIGFTSSGEQRVGRTDYLDKSMHGWGRKSDLADISVGAHIGNDFSNGHRGMAKAVKGAKKYVKSRIRFHENAATKKLMEEVDDE